MVQKLKEYKTEINKQKTEALATGNNSHTFNTITIKYLGSKIMTDGTSNGEIKRRPKSLSINEEVDYG